MAAEWHQVATVFLGAVSVGQTFVLFNKARKEREQSEARKSMTADLAKLHAELDEHIKEDRVMHERVQKAETNIDSLKDQLYEARERHGELVSRIDLIHQTMLTKDDLKMLVEIVRKGGL